LTFSEIASPQQMHIRGLMLSAVSTTLHQETSPDNQGATLMLGWEKISEPPRINRDTGATARHRDHAGCVPDCEGLMRLFLAWVRSDPTRVEHRGMARPSAAAVFLGGKLFRRGETIFLIVSNVSLTYRDGLVGRLAQRLARLVYTE
jgi:hypothetical protein